MKNNTINLDDEDLRLIANTEQLYDAWISAQRELLSIPAHMAWKTVSGREYLYARAHNQSEPKSLGLRSLETEGIKLDYERRRSLLDDSLEASEQRMVKLLRQYQALHLPQIMSLPGKILRELDRWSLLGSELIVVGTVAFPAYEIEARERFARGMDETEDFDLGWCRGAGLHLFEQPRSEPEIQRASGSPLFSVLKKVDPSFRINREKPYQAINRTGFEVELLTAPSVMKTLSPDEVFRTAAIPEQEWLLEGTPIRHVVCARDGSPVPLVTPDPRWMGLHKLWLSKKETRRADKKDKDARQGDLLLDAVARKMTTSHPMDVDFILSLPEELLDEFNAWAGKRGFSPLNKPPRSGW